MKYMAPFLKYFSSFPLFTAGDVKLFLHKNGARDDYYKLFVHNLIDSGRMSRIKRGYYTLHDDLMVSGFAFSPFYYGLGTALTYYKLWDYVTPICIITTKPVRSGMRGIFGRNVVVRRIAEKAFFGYDMVNYENMFYVPMASIEKTLIDSAYFHSNFNADVYREIAKRISKKRLWEYMRDYPQMVRTKVKHIVKEYR